MQQVILGVRILTGPLPPGAERLRTTGQARP